ncbi:MAG TPA: nucleoside triphosphate pyrophosphatase [Steroidobacteraceae bacterium]|jgi:septum formation protein|nr:nucleoside triphosphate pyrophosphatase [Steroidobacteraceae bacterium]
MSAGPLYLASSSPRRRALLDQIGVTCTVRPVDVDEARQPGEAPRDYVLRLARDKAQAGWSRYGQEAGGAVLAADTAVVVEGEIFGKPRDPTEGSMMLSRLSGRTHEVMTAVALRTAEGLDDRLSVSQVTFRALRPDESERYWHSGEPADKAGAYAVQGHGAVFITHLSGSYSGVMGLPLFETADLLQRAGFDLWMQTPRRS